MVNLLQQANLMNITTEVKYEAKLHWISYVFPTLLTLIGLIGILPAIFFRGLLQIIAFFLIFLLMKGILMSLQNKSTKIILSDRLLTIKTGIFSKRISDISLQRIEGINIHQSFLGKTLNYGTIHVSTGEINHRYFISNPVQLRSAILEVYKK